MPTDRRIVYNDNPIRKQCIMRNMTTRQKQSIIANLSDPAAAFGARIHRYMLADTIAGPDKQPRLLALEFFILRNFSQHCERKNGSVIAYICAPGHNHMAFQNHAIT
jgi:hypothetical protein